MTYHTTVEMQVNTSGEESKFGVQPEEAPGLAQHIQQQCKNLRFRGLMTIGECLWMRRSSPDMTESYSQPISCSDRVCQHCRHG